MKIHNFQIEPVEGCTRRCDFCGINQILDKVKKPNYMTLETVKLIANQIGKRFKQNIRIEFAVHGEPLLHPNIDGIIRIFRSYLHKAQLSVISNGDPLLKRNMISRIFNAGLNYLMVDFYDEIEVDRNRRIMEIINNSGVDVKDFCNDNVNIWSYRGSEHQQIIVTADISDNSGKKPTRKIHAAGGNLPAGVWDKYNINKKELPKFTRCAKPFREMSINYDGNISLCCEDWRRQQVISNIWNEGLYDIWNGELFNRYRYLLYHKRRDLIDICKYCNEQSFRVGLLKLDKEYPELIQELDKKTKNYGLF